MLLVDINSIYYFERDVLPFYANRQFCSFIVKYLLTEIPKHIEDKDARKTYLDDLLPWSENLPDICIKPT